MYNHQTCNLLRQLDLLCSGPLGAELVDRGHVEGQSVEGVTIVDQRCQKRRGLFGEKSLAMNIRVKGEENFIKRIQGSMPQSGRAMHR